MPDEIISFEPATGAELWRGEVGDAATEVGIARDSWAGWAAQSLSFRIETLRRFANVVRARSDAFADTIARETGIPVESNLYNDSLGDPPADTYEGMIRWDVDRVV